MFCRSREEDAMKLLLIEDDEAVAHVLAEAFGLPGSRDGPSSIRARTGLAYLTRERPDAVVLDVRLPKLNGVACSAKSGRPIRRFRSSS